jgi:stress response protein SCP2
MQNKIYLRRKFKLILSEKDSSNSKQHLTTVLKNIESLGFTFDNKILNILKTYSVEDLNLFYKKVDKDLRELVGANVNHKPMYPNFPTQVMNMEESELYWNAIYHYITLENPNTENITGRKKLKNIPDLQIIKLSNKDEFFIMFGEMISSKVAWSNTDKEDITWFVKQYRNNMEDFLPLKLENKENLSFLIGLLKSLDLLSDEICSRYFRTATDVLRLMVSLSGGDTSLVVNTKFKKFKRSDRKLFLSILERCPNVTEDMLKYNKRWIRIGEILHPNDYHKQFPKTIKAFDIIRNNKPFKTFNNQFEKLIKTKEVNKLVKHCQVKPGEFARRLDWILRKNTKHVPVLKSFEQVAHNVSTNVLLQVMNHFQNRNTNPYRAFIPKGVVNKIVLQDNNLPKIKKESCKKVVEICKKTLKKRFSKQEPLKNTYVDENLKNYPVPFALRSASKSFKTLTRGSKVTIEDINGKKTKYIRFFLYWQNLKLENRKNIKRGGDLDYSNDNRVDVDLSACFYDENLDSQTRKSICYYNLENEKLRSYHSGDIVDAPQGASEFIDIDIDQALEQGYRYLLLNANLFTHQSFKDIPVCFVGCMIRSNINDGEIFEPSTVKYKFDITSDSRVCVPLIFDLKERQVIWVDSTIGSDYYINNVGTNKKGLEALVKAFVYIPKPNLYDLFELHATSRGKSSIKSKANTIFSETDGVTPYDIETITSKYL